MSRNSLRAARRTALALLSLPALVLPALGSPARAEDIAFVLNSADASISEFDTTTLREIRRLPVLREPHHMATTPDGKSLVVGDTAGNAAFFLDAQTGLMQRRVPMSDPYQLQYSPNGRLLTVAGLARDQVDIYDASTLALLHRVPARSMPSHINYSPDSATVYVSLQGTGHLIAIDTASGRVLWDAPVGKTPAGVLWHNNKLLVGLMGATYVAEVDPATGQVDRRIEMAPGPHNLFVSPSRRLLYVTCRISGTIQLLDWDSLAILKTFHVPGGPDDIVIAPDGKLWATLRWRQKVAIIDPATGAATFLPTGRSPHGIWLNTTEAPRQLSLR